MDTYKNITSVQRQSEYMHSPNKIKCLKLLRRALLLNKTITFSRRIKLERKQSSTICNTTRLWCSKYL